MYQRKVEAQIENFLFPLFSQLLYKGISWDCVGTLSFFNIQAVYQVRRK
jgi:hypothetical protein